MVLEARAGEREGTSSSHAGISSWGAKSERSLPCMTEAVGYTPRDDIWRKPTLCSPKLTPHSDDLQLETHAAWQKPDNGECIQPGNTVEEAKLDCSSFHMLLQQVERLHNQEISDLESQLEVFRETGRCHQTVQITPQETVPGSEVGMPSGHGSERSRPFQTDPFFRHTFGSSETVDQDGQVAFDSEWETPQYIKDHIEASRPNRGRKSVISRNLSKLVTETSMEESKASIYQNKVLNFINKMVQSPTFDAFCALAITANAILLGIATDIAAGQSRQSDPNDLPKLFTYTDRVFTCWFLFELSLRMLAVGMVKFFCSRLNWSWNCFDFLVVATDLVETSATFFSGDSGSSFQNLTAIRMLRVLRIVRAIRVIRLVRFFKELRMMVFSILRSGLSLLWSMILLTIIIFIFSVYLTQSVTFYLHYEVTDDNDVTEKLQMHFGSLIYAGYMLFQCISGGVSWGEVGGPLLEIHWSHVLVLCFYVFFAIFAVLNIITGIFVDTAINSAQADRDEVIQEAVHSEKSHLRQMQRFFHEADVDRSGSVTLKEMEAQFQNQRVRAHFRTLGIEVNDARSIFYLLDTDNSGEISIEEFLFGCLKMKGQARSIDLITLIHENRRLKCEMQRLFSSTGEKLQKLEDSLMPLGHRGRSPRTALNASPRVAVSSSPRAAAPSSPRAAASPRNVVFASSPQATGPTSPRVAEKVDPHG